MVGETMFNFKFKIHQKKISLGTAGVILLVVLVLVGVIYLWVKPSGNDGDAKGAQGRKAGERNILFYRNPMNPAITSPSPAKDEMGMDYIPVYADEGNTPSKPMAQKVDEFFGEDLPDSAKGEVEGLAPVTLSNEGIELAGVLTARVRSDVFQSSIRTVGRVIADEALVRMVQTRVSGWVEKMFVQSAGQMVNQGHPILSLYSPELLSSQEEFLQAGAAAEKLSTSSDLETRKFGLELQRSAERRLNLLDVPDAFIMELAKTKKPQRAITLIAPISGFVMLKDVFEGQQVEPGMTLFVITDLTRIWVEADFYEYEGKALRLGQEATITSSYDPALELQGKVALLFPYLNTESRTIKARLEFPNDSLVLRPGMYVDVDLRIDLGRSLMVPESAVLDSGPRKVVFVEKGGGRFEPREVRTGGMSDGNIQILEGVTEGEMVAIKANFLLDSESRLQAVIQGVLRKKKQ